MSIENMNISHEMGETGGRFVARIEGHADSEVTYSITTPKLVIADHTGVPDSLRGKGVGQALVIALIDHARANEIKIMPLCPFIRAQFQRHPEWADLIAK